MHSRPLARALISVGVLSGLGSSPARAGNDVVIDFESLAQAGTGVQTVGPSYAEDGFTISGVSFGSFQLDETRFAGSTGLFEGFAIDMIELVKSDGGAFRLASIDLDPLNNGGNPTTVTFIGERGGMQVAMQTITTSTSLTFETFVFNADFANVDRVTWTQSNIGGDFHQFDDIVLTPPMATVIDFESLAQPGTGNANIGPSYSEDGFTITPAVASFAIRQTSSPLFAGSTGIWAVDLTTIELVKDDGGAFRLAAIDLSRLNSVVRATTVTFTGHRDGSPVASQMFTTSTDLAFQPFIFGDGFKNVDRVTWVQQFTPDTHQFDDIVLGEPVEAILESAALGATGVPLGSGSAFIDTQLLGCRFSLNGPARISEIGGHLIVSNGSIWGAIIPLEGPGAIPPDGFDLEANALAHALFESTGTVSEDRCKPVDVVLGPGDYALVFGAGGLFGSTGLLGASRITGNDSDTPQASYFFGFDTGASWIDGGFFDARFVVRGTSIPCNNCTGDANGDLMVNFSDVTTILGNWLNACPTVEPILETAEFGTAMPIGALMLTATQYLGARFSLSEETKISGIGGSVRTFGGTVWAAILPLSGPGALPPDGFDVEGGALASALLGPTGGFIVDALEAVDVTLAPGDYALVIGGGGLFGSTGSGEMPRDNTEIGTPSFFFFDSTQIGWIDGLVDRTRFVVVGDPLCSTCEGDANSDGGVNFSDVTAVLGNWLSVCP